MAVQTQASGTWNVLLVEDDDTVRRQVREYLINEQFASRTLNISDIADLDQALNLIRERKADLVILDVYRGQAQQGGEQVGIQVLGSIKGSGFVPVVLYTALPEGLDDHQSKFVRLVGKDAGGLEKLKEEISDLFALRIPQLNRAIVNHIDQTMCKYMWEFVGRNWSGFESILDKPEFLRLVVQRLALTLSRRGIDTLAAEVYDLPPAPAPASDDLVHPSECYIKPPIGDDPALGDIRCRERDGTPEYLVVLWPTCDMVSSGGRQRKTEAVLCARAVLATSTSEVQDWRASASNNKRKRVEALIGNTREKSPDRYHFLPGVWDIPNLVVDFQNLEHLPVADVSGLSCLATLASPFAESLAVRFQKYVGRVGTPDLDAAVILSQLQQTSDDAPGGSADAS